MLCSWCGCTFLCVYVLLLFDAVVCVGFESLCDAVWRVFCVVVCVVCLCVWCFRLFKVC